MGATRAGRHRRRLVGGRRTGRASEGGRAPAPAARAPLGLVPAAGDGPVSGRASSAAFSSRPESRAGSATCRARRTDRTSARYAAAVLGGPASVRRVPPGVQLGPLTRGRLALAQSALRVQAEGPGGGGGRRARRQRRLGGGGVAADAGRRRSAPSPGRAGGPRSAGPAALPRRDRPAARRGAGGGAVRAGRAVPGRFGRGRVAADRGARQGPAAARLLRGGPRPVPRPLQAAPPAPLQDSERVRRAVRGVSQELERAGLVVSRGRVRAVRILLLPVFAAAPLAAAAGGPYAAVWLGLGLLADAGAVVLWVRPRRTLRGAALLAGLRREHAGVRTATLGRPDELLLSVALFGDPALRAQLPRFTQESGLLTRPPGRPMDRGGGGSGEAFANCGG
nr:TIGR04222 domain-containing membrane protein [Streptomyces sp. WAC07149]